MYKVESQHGVRSLQRGFTLIELMVVVAIAAILASLAAPAFKSIVASQRVRTAALEFSTALTLARSEAIKRNGNVQLNAAAGGWAAGWTVQTASAVVISSKDAFQNVTVQNSGGAFTQITYLPTGRLLSAVAPLQFADSDNGNKRCVALDLSGLPVSKVGAC